MLEVTRAICRSMTASSMQLCANPAMMFVSDSFSRRAKLYRVFKRDGLFLFNVWDAMRHNKLGELALIGRSPAILRMTLQRSTRFLLVTTMEPRSGGY